MAVVTRWWPEVPAGLRIPPRLLDEQELPGVEQGPDEAFIGIPATSRDLLPSQSHFPLGRLPREHRLEDLKWIAGNR